MREGRDEPEVRPGLVSPELAAEHPGLWLAWAEVEAVPGPTPPELRERLRAMADRIRGADAIVLRRREVPHAHRVFFHHVGLDPDVARGDRAAAHAAGRPAAAGPDRRRAHGGDAGDRRGHLGVRRAALVGALGLRVEGGRLVIADEQGPVTVLFREPDGRAAVPKRTGRVALAAVGVPGVPDLYVHEALWTAWYILA